MLCVPAVSRLTKSVLSTYCVPIAYVRLYIHRHINPSTASQQPVASQSPLSPPSPQTAPRGIQIHSAHSVRPSHSTMCPSHTRLEERTLHMNGDIAQWACECVAVTGEGPRQARPIPARQGKARAATYFLQPSPVAPHHTAHHGSADGMMMMQWNASLDATSSAPQLLDPISAIKTLGGSSASRQTDRQTDRRTSRQNTRPPGRPTQPDSQTVSQTIRQTDSHTARRTITTSDGQTDRQTDGHTHTDMHSPHEKDGGKSIKADTT